MQEEKQLFTASDVGHTYELMGTEGVVVQELQFVKKEEVDGQLKTIIDGTTNEAVVAVLADRLTFLDTQVPSDFNKIIVGHLSEISRLLTARTEDRKARLVEGTSKI